jgi:formiminotetrahydrofolate cyclodeaminase
MTRNETIERFAERVAAGSPTPGGGAVAAVTGALAAALTAMAGRLTPAPEGQLPPSAGHLIEAADHLSGRLLDLAKEDEEVYRVVLQARRSGDRVALARAWRGAARVPADVVRLCREVALLARRAALEGPPAAIGDAVMAALLAAAAAAGSQLNLRLNLAAAGRPEELRALADQADAMLRDTQRAVTEVRLIADEQLRG